jgi:hypothetical protein
MSYTGTVSKGTVILPSDAKLPDGTRVRVEPIEEIPAAESIGKKLVKMAGILKDLPSDFAENHDHYVHGTPKRHTP